MTVLTGAKARAKTLAALRPKKGRGRPADSRKVRAVAMVLEGKSRQEIEAELGSIPDSTLGTWVRDARKASEPQLREPEEGDPWLAGD